MNKDENNKKGNDNRFEKNPNANRNPVNSKQQEIKPDSRSWERSENPNPGDDRKGRNIDTDLENRENEIVGREQKTTPKNKAKDIAEGLGSREQQQKERNRHE